MSEFEEKFNQLMRINSFYYILGTMSEDSSVKKLSPQFAEKLNELISLLHREGQEYINYFKEIQERVSESRIID